MQPCAGAYTGRPGSHKRALPGAEAGLWSILQVPISLNLKKSLENPAITSPEDRLIYFGQDDHVRLYSQEDFTARLEAAGFIVEQYDFAEHHGLEEPKRYGLSAGDTLYIGRKKAL
ncbi:hypothetical protein [Bacillus infantis]|uniref:hypothetical protein n=1 Tax=Bacillus infantis TaxID=324767 RepID=UPI003CF67601